MENIEFDTYCGLTCKDCSFKESNGCKGCIATGGKPFHGRCDVADCANKKQKSFCGSCESFPCEVLKGYSYDKQYGDNGERIENCRRIKALLDKEKA